MKQLLQRLVVGVDGSPASAEAIALAIRIARSHGSELIFCHAIDYAIVASDSGAAVIDALTHEGETLLCNAQAIAQEAGIRAQPRILEGRPEYAIVGYATDAVADAIVVGTRGKSASERFFLGSTAEGVLRLSLLPVFVAHGPSLMAPTAFERIVVAIDNSDPSDAAIQFATRLAAADRSHLTFCHVVDDNTLYEEAANFGGATYPVLHEWLEEANVLSAVAAENADGAEIPSVETTILTGNPVTELLSCATAERADLIAIGAHGRRGLRHLLMGSVAEAIVRRSGLPVVVVRALAPYTAERPALHPHVDQHGYATLRPD